MIRVCVWCGKTKPLSAKEMHNECFRQYITARYSTDNNIILKAYYQGQRLMKATYGGVSKKKIAKIKKKIFDDNFVNDFGNYASYCRLIEYWGFYGNEVNEIKEKVLEWSKARKLK